MSESYATAPEPKPDTAGHATAKAAQPAGSQAAVAFQEPSAEAEEAEDLAYANAALLRVTRRLDDASGGLSELAVSLRSAGDDPEQLGAAEQVLDQIQSLKDILRRIRKRGRKHQNPGDAFSVVTQVTALGHLKEALPHIWALISRLITPAQWTASGTVGTGIFGIASATITVTFGKD